MAGAGTSSESSGLSSPAYAAERSHAGPTIDSVAVSTTAVTVSAALQGECSARPTRHRRRVDFFGIRLAKRCSIFASTARRRCLGPPSCAPALVARSPVAAASDASQRSLRPRRRPSVLRCADGPDSVVTARRCPRRRHYRIQWVIGSSLIRGVWSRIANPRAQS